MSKNLSSVAETEFDSEVKHAYQDSGKLRHTVTTRTGVTGDTYSFTRIGKGLANQKATQATVTPMDVAHDRQAATLINWLAPEYTDIFDQAEVSFDERVELAQTIAKALSRREDQLIIDAVEAGTYTAATTDPDVGETIAAGGTQFTVAKLRTAARHLSSRGVPEEDRYIMYTAEDRDNLLGETEATSSDFATVKALVNGQIDSFVGFKFNLIATRVEGGLGSNLAFAYHKSSIGYAVAKEPTTRVDWVADRTSWLANGCLKSGCVLREAAGIVEINMA